ncbi:MAG: FMN-binding protein [Desulfatiglandaceae bacterium]
MKEIIRITFGLTLSCLVAGLLMGSVFIITDEAKKQNEQINEHRTMMALLGYDKQNPAPSDFNMHTFYRYIIQEGDVKTLGYLLPVGRGEEVGYDLVILDLEGQFVRKEKVGLTPEAAAEASERKAALREVLSPSKSFTYADSTTVACLGDKRMAYLIPGEFPGFKTFIEVMMAVDPSFEVIGLEIMEHEEDPGLGAEIEQDYFKNQFDGKSFDQVKGLKVIKEPMPEAYREYLESETSEETIPKEAVDMVRRQYQDEDIYALTGATISSQAVTAGVKNMMKKFAYRVEILNDVISHQDIPVVF